MNKSDARGEDDPGQREEELVCFMLRLKVLGEKQISSGHSK